MRGEKRQWVYQGLAVPEGVGLVRRARPSRPEPAADRRLLLCGGELVRQIFPPLSKLVNGSDTSIYVDCRPQQSAHEWAKHAWLRVHLATFRPTAALLALDPSDLLARKLIQLRVEKYGAKLLWLVPYGVECADEPDLVPAPARSVTALAAWAGRVWEMAR